MRGKPKVKRLALCLAVLFVLGAAPLPLGAAAAAKSTDERPYYIIDEEFAFVRRADSTIMPQQPSGWDVKAAGGELSGGYNSWFNVKDGSTLLPMEMTKEFREENEGYFGTEFRFSMVKMMEGTTWRIRQGEKVAVGFIVSGGNLCLETSGAPKVLFPIATNKDIGVRANFSLDTKMIESVYINGEEKAKDVPLKDAVTGIDNYNVKTTDEAVGEMFLNPIKLFKGYSVNERFIATVEKTFPEDWSLDKKGGNATVSRINSTTPPDFFSLKFEDTSATDSVSVSKSFSPLGGSVNFEFKVMFPARHDGFEAAAYSGSGQIISLATDNGEVVVSGADGAAVRIGGYLENLWYSYRLSLDPGAKVATIWQNGRTVGTVALSNGYSAVDKLVFKTGEQAKGVVWLDDMLLWANPPLPEDYVPVPNPVSPGDDVYVVMQNCSLWREGHHVGWDPMTDFPDRTPLIGFYDEGNPEVADWETKFLVEHGVNVMKHSWFRPNSGDAPIKDPYTAAYALHDGYFYSEYSDMIKYMIYWENGGAGPANGSEDFRKNFVPFWIEYYFKDPRYLKIDNKPVISFLTSTGLVRDFGNDPVKIKAELDYLRDECKKAGFDGAYIISNTTSTSQTEMELKKSMGVDSNYAYNWSFETHYIEPQKVKAIEQRKYIDAVATLGMGRDNLAWGGPEGGYLTPKEYEDLVRWWKDEFAPTSREGGLGSRMFICATWNEYGEGHFIMPSGIYGFGYLDAIRNVFVGDGAHDDALPTEAAKIRMSRLFSVPRVVPRIKKTTPPAGESETEVLWKFDTEGDTLGWTPVKHVAGLTVRDGALTGTNTDNDPGVYSPKNLDIDIDNVPYVRIRYKYSDPSRTSQLFFITEDDQTWDEAKSYKFPSSADTSKFEDHVIFTWDNAKWKGKLLQLRLDPFGAPNDQVFNYEEIEIMRLPGSHGGVKVLVDGVAQRYDQPPVIINDRTMVPLRAIFQQLGAKIDWDGKTRTVTSFKSGRVVELTIGNSTAYIDRKPQELDQPPEIVGDRTMVPIRFVSEAMGAGVAWDEATRTVSIDTSTVVTTPPPEGPNLVAGGDMEGKSMTFSNWAAELSLTTKEFHGGKQSLMVDATQNYGCAKFPVVLEEGAEYYYSAWVKLGSNVKSGSVLRLVANYKLGNDTIQKIAVSSEPLTQGKWTFVSGRYIISEGAPVSDTLLSVFTDTPAAGGTFYLDDVTVIKVGGAPPAAKTPAPTKTPEPTKAPAATDAPAGGKSEAAERKGNLVKDAGFEGKSYQHQGWGGEVLYSKDTAYTGNQSLKVVKENGYGSVKLNVDMTNNVEYEISAWFKKGAGSAGTVVRCVLSYKYGGEKFEKIIETLQGLSDDDWKQLKFTYTIDEKEKISEVYINFFTDLPAAEGDVYYVDDVIIAPTVK